MTAELRFALEESNRVCKVPNYFGYTDAKQHAWETLPTRNDQLLAVLKVLDDYEVPSKQDDVTGEICNGMERLEEQIRQAIQEAA